MRGHVHSYYGITSFDFGHVHYFRGTSSRNYGGVDYHTHVLAGRTTFDQGHTHFYRVITGPGIPAGYGYHIHPYFVVTSTNGRVPHVHLISGYTAPAPNDRYYY